VTRAYHPGTLAEAVRVLGDPEIGAVPVAGCTDLLVVDYAQRREHPAVVDLLRVPELSGIRRVGDWLDIGAATTFGALRKHVEVREHAPILAEVATTVGAWQIQNRATIGGNIANASPAGDSLPGLLALGAELVLAGPGGERTIAYTEFHTGYRQTALAPGELIARVRVPVPPAGSYQAFRKVGTREAQAISKVVVAVAARREEGNLTEVRIAAGSIAATPVRLVDAERACEGRRADRVTAERAGAAAAGEVQPIDDVRSTADYRRWVLERVVRRLVLGAARRSEG
jgi:CO/xanthine dehydrogenase FAD-binding subunit